MEYRSRYESEIRELISQNFDLDAELLRTLPSKEGVILTDGSVVFKCLTLLNEHIDLLRFALRENPQVSPRLASIHRNFIETDQYILHNFLRLESLAEAIRKQKPKRIISLQAFRLQDYIVLKMPYVEVSNYEGGYEEEMISLMRELKEIRWVSTDMNPDNVKMQETATGPGILLLDMGYFYVPFYEKLFQTMCRRAYVSMNFATGPNIKILLRSANKDTEFTFLEDSERHRKSFGEFFRKIDDEE